MANINDIEKLAELRDKGIISPLEFEEQKAALLKSAKLPEGEPKSRLAFILLGIFLGCYGVHNFYAGYTGKAVAQLLITLLLFWLIVPILVTFIWAIVEVCTVTKDAKGIPFAS